MAARWPMASLIRAVLPRCGLSAGEVRRKLPGGPGRVLPPHPDGTPQVRRAGRHSERRGGRRELPPADHFQPAGRGSAEFPADRDYPCTVSYAGGRATGGDAARGCPVLVLVRRPKPARAPAAEITAVAVSAARNPWLTAVGEAKPP
jgi:hypothetical protein